MHDFMSHFRVENLEFLCINNFLLALVNLSTFPICIVFASTSLCSHNSFAVAASIFSGKTSQQVSEWVLWLSSGLALHLGKTLREPKENITPTQDNACNSTRCTRARFKTCLEENLFGDKGLNLVSKMKETVQAKHSASEMFAVWVEALEQNCMRRHIKWKHSKGLDGAEEDQYHLYFYLSRYLEKLPKTTE